MAALRDVALANPNPKFSAVKPKARRRWRVLSPSEEKAYFEAAKEWRWFYRIAKVANLTALDLSSIIRLSTTMLKPEQGEIQITGGRKKTCEVHNAPLLPEVREAIDEQLEEQRQNKVRNKDKLIFTQPNGQPLTPEMIRYPTGSRAGRPG